MTFTYSFRFNRGLSPLQLFGNSEQLKKGQALLRERQILIPWGIEPHHISTRLATDHLVTTMAPKVVNPPHGRVHKIKKAQWNRLRFPSIDSTVPLLNVHISRILSALNVQFTCTFSNRIISCFLLPIRCLHLAFCLPSIDPFP
jgi:hypothetical protein